jgi:pentatricopeptide repeat protein
VASDRRPWIWLSEPLPRSFSSVIFEKGGVAWDRSSFREDRPSVSALRYATMRFGACALLQQQQQQQQLSQSLALSLARQRRGWAAAAAAPAALLHRSSRAGRVVPRVAATTTSAAVTEAAGEKLGPKSAAAATAASQVARARRARPVGSRKRDPLLERIHNWRESKGGENDVMKEALAQPKALHQRHWYALAVAAAQWSDMSLCKNIVAASENAGFRFDVRSYTRMVHAASRRRRWLMVGELLELMREADEPANDVTYTALLSEMARAAQYELVEEVIQTEGLTMSTDIYNALITGCSKSGRVGAAYRYFEAMLSNGVRPTGMTFASLLACSSGRPQATERARVVFSTMESLGIKPDCWCLNAYMGLLTSAGQPHKALEVYESFSWRGVEPDTVSLNSAMAALERMAHADEALKLLRRAEGAAVGPVPNLITYNSVLSALGKAGMWQKALELMDEMRARGERSESARPCVVTYNSLMSACARGGQPHLSLELFREMEEKGIRRDVYSYGAALHACLAASDWQKSLELVAEMRQAGIKGSPVVYGTTTNACIDANQLLDAARVVKTGIANGACATPPTLVRLFTALYDADRMDVVQDLMADVLAPKMQHSTRQTVLLAAVTACSRSRPPRPTQAMEILQDYQPSSPQRLAAAFAMTLRACTAAEDLETGHSVLLLLQAESLSPHRDEKLAAAMSGILELAQQQHQSKQCDQSLALIDIIEVISKMKRGRRKKRNVVLDAGHISSIDSSSSSSSNPPTT